MKLKVIGPSGAKVVEVEDSARLSHLKTQLLEQFAIDSGSTIELLTGFPPKPCKLPLTTPLSSFLKHGDSLRLLVQPETNKPASSFSSVTTSIMSSATSFVTNEATAAQWSCGVCTLRNSPGRSLCDACGSPNPSSTFVDSASSTLSLPTKSYSLLARREKMPDDNSCLFHGVSFLLQSSLVPSELRQLVARTVRADPSRWNAATLGKASVAEYIAFITDPVRWGGQVELAIFARHFRSQLGVLDVESGRLDVYGEDQAATTQRGYLLMTGLHFDAVCFSSGQKLVERKDWEAADRAVRALGGEMKQNGEFTSKDTMRLQCKVCGVVVKGDYQARLHAGTKGHKEFRPV
eukprot:gb/GEZN01008376.1/.p1 GENE.gb/GEZN01008376.1/~~gb/GEZN01008376.1/.p1  ORF type:complete len:349 (-),score=51.76 gb/GEZN01008376.1/:356-1402(-)